MKPSSSPFVISRTLRASLALLAGLGLVGCEGAQPGVDSERSAITNGTTVTSDLIGTPFLTIPGESCSGVMLSDRWLLTAHHCLTVEQVQTGGTAVTPSSATVTTLDGQQAVGTAVFLHPTLDVALLQISQSLLAPDGHPFGTPLSTTPSSNLANQMGLTLYNQGWGVNNDATQAGGGVLRSQYGSVSPFPGGFITIPNFQGQGDDHGDSGSPWLSYWNGHWNIIGIVSRQAGSGSPPSAFSVGVEYFRDWVEGVVGNAAALFDDGGFSNTSQQLLPGGPTFGQYNLAQLSVGNDAVSSWMSPLGATTNLYGDSGFQTLLLASQGAAVQANVPPVDNDQVSSASISNWGVRLFLDGNLSGSFVTLGQAGRYVLTGFDNVVSSLTVPAGWQIVLFDNPNFTGDNISFTEGTYNEVDSGFNDRASSVVVREPAALYVDSQYDNTVSKLLGGFYNLAAMGIPNDSVSSVFVPTGSYVLLTQDDNFFGNTAFFTTSQPTLPTFNDSATSAAVFNAPAAGCGTLAMDEALLGGQSLSSCDGRFTLVLQNGGNLVLNWNGVGVLWQTNSSGSSPLLTLQDNPVLALYSTSPTLGSESANCAYGPAQGGTYAPAGCLPALETATINLGSYMSLQNDGNLVMYRDPSHPLWATNTCCH